MISTAVVTETQKGVPALIDSSMKAVAATATTTCHALNTSYVPTPVRVRVQTLFAIV